MILRVSGLTNSRCRSTPSRCHGSRSGAKLAWGGKRCQRAMAARRCHVTRNRAHQGRYLNTFHAEMTAAVQLAIASALNGLKVEPEMRWRCRNEVLWTAACRLRNRCAELADLKRCILRSRRRTTWCEFSARCSYAAPARADNSGEEP